MEGGLHLWINPVGIDLYEIGVHGFCQNFTVFQCQTYAAMPDVLRTAAGIDKTDAVLLYDNGRMVM